MDVLEIFTNNTFKLAELNKKIEDEFKKLQSEDKDDDYRVQKFVSLANTSIKAMKTQADIAKLYADTGDELRLQLFADIKDYIDLLWQQTLVNTFENTGFDKYLENKGVLLDDIKTDVLANMKELDGNNRQEQIN
ncbi:MAG: hypothetical protein LBT91_02665 [Bifidobacteriaceae bacterium]|jgi:uncharacterized ubiquitin-like protein YukD|nr:hypothetical protein [Bifidobacteriaceae bacterium]